MLQLAIEEEYSSEKEPKIEFPAEDPIQESAGYTVHSVHQEQPQITESAAVRAWNVPEKKQTLKTEFQTPTTRPVLQRQITKEDFDVDVLTMQTELESLKDVIGNQMTLDMDTVASLFDGSVETLPAM